jgi:hypothetical protein
MSSSFKYKPTKKIILDEKSITTLDSKHKELQTEYQYAQDSIIPALKKEKNELKHRITKIKIMIGNSKSTLHNNTNEIEENNNDENIASGICDDNMLSCMCKHINDENNYDDTPKIVNNEPYISNISITVHKPNLSKHNPIIKTTIDELMESRDRIKEINQLIKNYEQAYKNYYLNNSEYIFEYFESKKTITTGGATKTKSLNAFFKLPEAKKAEELHMIQHNNVQKYLSNIDHNYIDISKYVYPTDICQFCYQGEMIPVESEGIMVCNHCAKHVVFLIDNEKPSYKEPPKEACFYAYKRINHFREILAQFQAKETTSIPENVLESIKQQIKKERIEISQFTDKKAKEIMKKLGFNKYYEHIPFIKDKLGIKPPVMTPDLEDRLCNLFMEIQGPYAKFCPDDRVNFLNYYYTVYKLCELLGRREFLPFFPMLKDREKRIEQDQIWKKICIELDWEFIPTP